MGSGEFMGEKMRPAAPLREAANLNLFDVPWTACMHKAWQGVAGTVQKDGRVAGVSAGTGPSGSAGYQAKEVGTYTWGTGALLLAACAAAKCTAIT